jgi:hypothetical protein
VIRLELNPHMTMFVLGSSPTLFLIAN